MLPHLRNLLPGLKSLVWSEKNLLFAGIGSILGFSADFASFLTNFASPVVLLGVALVMTTGLALLCTPKIFRADLENAAEVDAVSKCLECDLLRLSLFTCFGLALLFIVGQGQGQGQTATERLGRQLGVIETRLDPVVGTTEEVKETTEQIDQTTDAIRGVTASGEINPSPKTAEEFYRNAFICSCMRQDAAKAWESIDALKVRAVEAGCCRALFHAGPPEPDTRPGLRADDRRGARPFGRSPDGYRCAQHPGFYRGGRLVCRGAADRSRLCNGLLGYPATH